MSKLYIQMNNTLVGVLEKSRGGSLALTYAESWIMSSYARSLSLSMPLTRTPYKGDVVNNFLENLLPDNLFIRQKIQQRFATKTDTAFDLLAAIGQDCVGAIQLTDKPVSSDKKLHYKPLSDAELVKILDGYRTNPLGMLEEEQDFRISLAGAQEKTALLWYQGQWCLPLGNTPTSHIIKLPIGHLDYNGIDLSQSCENEWLCMQLIKAFGLPVANTELLQVAGKTFLAVERFDRKWMLRPDGETLLRLPQEDLCQAFGISPALKYEADGGIGIKQALEILQGSQNAARDREDFFKSQIVFWLLAAPDGHAKNFSIFLEQNNAYRMTPFYDVLSAYPFMHAKGIPKQKLKMAMALEGKSRHYLWNNIQPRHFISTAKNAGYSSSLARQHLEEVLAKVPQVIQNVESKLPVDFPKAISEAILGGLKSKAEGALQGTF